MKMRLIVQEIKNEPPSTPSTPRRNNKLRDLAQLYKEMVSLLNSVSRKFKLIKLPLALNIKARGS
jgi:hypothetical protein